MEHQGLIAAIEIAVQAERSAREFYLAAAEKAASAHGKALFTELADFEAYHEEKLRELVKSLGIGDFIDYGPREVSRPSPEGGKETVAEVNSGEIANVLSLAMDAEAKAQKRYESLAETTKDLLGKAMFKRLALEEATHHRILSDEFYSISNTGKWVWAE